MERSVSPSIGFGTLRNSVQFQQHTQRLAYFYKSPASGTIYGIRSPSGKMYIGQTRQTLKKRWTQHKKPSSLNPNKCRVLARAIMKYGAMHMHVWAMEECVPLDQLGTREKALIAQHQTMVPNGYNITRGGDESPMCTPAVAAKSKATNRRPEVIARRAAIYASAPVKKRLKEAGRNRWKDPAYRTMMSKAKKTDACAQHYAKMRAAKPAIDYWAMPKVDAVRKLKAVRQNQKQRHRYKGIEFDSSMYDAMVAEHEARP